MAWGMLMTLTLILCTTQRHVYKYIIRTHTPDTIEYQVSGIRYQVSGSRQAPKAMGAHTHAHASAPQRQ